MTLDPAGLQVLLSRLDGAADEMGAGLRRSAFSPNIKERADCSAALFLPGGVLNGVTSSPSGGTMGPRIADPRARKLSWYGPVNGAAWVLVHRLAKRLGARVDAVRSPDGREWCPLVLEGEAAPEWLRGLRFDP